MKQNVLILRKYMLKHLGVKGPDVYSSNVSESKKFFWEIIKQTRQNGNNWWMWVNSI